MSDTESITCAPSADEFKTSVREWVMINDRISDMRKVIAEQNKRKKQLTEYIILFMKDNDKEICNLGENGILHMKTQKQQATLSKEHLTKWMSEFLKDEDKAKDLTKFVFEKKKEESVEKNVLKRSNIVI